MGAIKRFVSDPELWLLLLLAFLLVQDSWLDFQIFALDTHHGIHMGACSKSIQVPTLNFYCCCSCWHSAGAGFLTLDVEEEAGLLPSNNDVLRYLFRRLVKDWNNHISASNRSFLPTFTEFLKLLHLEFNWHRICDSGRGRGSRLASSK